jgi:hypothetical protein
VHDGPRLAVAFSSGETRTLPAPSAESDRSDPSRESGGPLSFRWLATHLDYAHPKS